MGIAVLGTAEKAVILGASGFFGIHLARQLVASGFDVVCVARQQSPYWPEGITYLRSDLRVTKQAVARAMQDAVVFHLASATRPSGHTKEAPLELTNNVIPTLEYLELTRDMNCRWVFASSGGTVYGVPQSDLIDENHATRPISAYGVNKLATEGYLRVYHSIHDTQIMIARISNLYGPHQNPKTGQGIIATLIDRILNNVEIEIWGDGSNIRDYLHVSDAAAALVAIAKKGVAGRIYNVGSGQGVSVVQIIELVSAHLNKSPGLKTLPARGMDVPRNVLDISRIEKELSWKPTTELDVGIEDTCQWFLKQIGDGK